MAERTCSIDGCERRAEKRGWCGMHYHRWRRHGDPEKAQRNVTRGPPAERFWTKVRKGPGCWEWTASVFSDRNGYGKFQAGSGAADARVVYAHRFSYELNVGPIPEGSHVCHHCDNPLCVRPDHLFLGSAADNMGDMARKGRGRAAIPVPVVQEVKRRLAAGGQTHREIAADLGIARHDVKNIRYAGHYRHVRTPAEVGDQ